MKLRPFALLALLVITSAMPLAAAAGICEAMPMCHRAEGDALVAPMPCCQPAMSCAPEPAAQPEATAADGARVAAVVALVSGATETPAPRIAQTAETVDTSPPATTRVRLAQLATLLI